MDQESIAFLGGVTDYRIIQHISTGKPDYYGTLHLTSYIPPYPTEIQYHKFCGGVGLQIYLYNHSQFDENHEYHINRVTYAELCWGPSRYVILQNSQIGEHAFAPEHYKTPIFTVNAGYLKGAMWDKSDFINETERKTALESALTALYEATRSDAEASGLLEQFPMNLSMVVQFFAEIYHS